MKRYWLFGMHDYYPSGGLHDLRGTFDTAEEALTHALKDRYDTTEVLDIQTFKLLQDGVWNDVKVHP